MKLISIVIPVYNESGNVAKMVTEIEKLNLEFPYELIFVNDGSSDNTLYILKELAAKNPVIKYVSFCRNFGKEQASKAGLDISRGEAVILMDGDLQHPPQVIPQMIKLWKEGTPVVHARRINTKKVSFFKRLTSVLYNKMVNNLSTIRLSDGETDFKLLDKKVVDVLRMINSPYLFLRGLIRWLGYESKEISFVVQERFDGETKFSFTKLFSLALSGILSFSVKPLYYTIYIGFFTAFLSIGVGVYSLVSYCLGYAVRGWASTLVIISFFAGIQIILLGVVGLYVGKIFISNQKNPPYLIDQTNYGQ